MTAEHFCLKWGNHHSNMRDAFSHLLNSETLCDVTIACEGYSLKAHRLVLSASSSFFHDLFVENPSSHPIIILTHLKFIDMKALVDFMYHGQVSVPENQISTILKAAENLKIKGLGDSSEHSSNLFEYYSGINDKSSSKTISDNLSKDMENNENANELNNDSCLTKTKNSDTVRYQPDLIHDDPTTSNLQTVEQTLECNFDGPSDVIPAKLMEQMMTTDGEFEEKLCIQNSTTSDHNYFESDSKEGLYIPEFSMKENTDDLHVANTFSDLQCSFKGVTLNRLIPSQTSESTFLDTGSNKDESSCSLHGGMTSSELSDTYPSGMQGVPSSQLASERSVLKLPVKCSTCSYTMNTLSDSQSHLSSNPNCRTSQFKCTFCPKIFIWPATLMKHFREQHEGPGGSTRTTQRAWFFCEVCKKPLLSKHALSLHKSKFHGISPHSSQETTEPYNAKRGRKQGTRVCRLCKRTFVGSTDYFTHLQSHHKNTSFSDSTSETQMCMNESLSSNENESNSAQSVT